MAGIGLVGGSGGSARKVAARYLAPLLFLVAATVAVLLVRSATRDEAGASRATRPAAPAPSPAARPAAARRRYYVIRAGDTLGSIAGRFGTSVARLSQLNPGISPTSLRIGQRIRIA